MEDGNSRPADLVGFRVSLSLGAQLAFTGQFVSTLIASKVLSRKQARDFLVNLAGTITSSLEESATQTNIASKIPQSGTGRPLLR